MPSKCYLTAELASGLVKHREFTDEPSQPSFYSILHLLLAFISVTPLHFLLLYRARGGLLPCDI